MKLSHSRARSPHLMLQGYQLLRAIVLFFHNDEIIVIIFLWKQGLIFDLFTVLRIKSSYAANESKLSVSDTVSSARPSHIYPNKHVFPTFLSQMEQPPIKFVISIRSAAARRKLRRCDIGGRRSPAESPQNGIVGVQSLLPSALRQPPRQTSDRHFKRRPVQRHALPIRFHVSR